MVGDNGVGIGSDTGELVGVELEEEIAGGGAGTLKVNIYGH